MFTFTEELEDFILLVFDSLYGEVRNGCRTLDCLLSNLDVLLSGLPSHKNQNHVITCVNRINIRIFISHHTHNRVVILLLPALRPLNHIILNILNTRNKSAHQTYNFEPRPAHRRKGRFVKH